MHIAGVYASFHEISAHEQAGYEGEDPVEVIEGGCALGEREVRGCTHIVEKAVCRRLVDARSRCRQPRRTVQWRGGIFQVYEGDEAKG